VSEKGASINPKTVVDWKIEELPKMIDRYQPMDSSVIFYNL
jgi:hypothetical protein